MRSIVRQHLRSLAFILPTLAIIAPGTGAQWRNPEPYGKDFLTIGEFNLIDAICASPFHVYFASIDGIVRYDIINGSWLEPIDFTEGIYGSRVNRMAVSMDDERLWVETEMGVFIYERVFARWEETFDFPIHEIRGKYVPPEHLFVTEPGLHYLPGGILLDDFGRRFDTHPNYLDESGYLWMGIQGLGPARSEPDGGRLQLLSFGLLDREISALGAQGGLLQIGSQARSGDRSGVTFLDPQSGEFSYLEQALDQSFPLGGVSAFSDTEESWLVGGELGLYEVDKQSMTVIEHFSRFNGLPHTTVTAVSAVGEIVLVGTKSGLGMIAADSVGAKEVAQLALTFQEIYALAPDFVASRGRLSHSTRPSARFVWVGAEEGVYRLDTKNFSLKKLNDPELILHSPTRNLRMSGANLWALADNGLVRLDLRSGDIQSFPEFSNNDWRSTMAVNSEFVALGSDNGLTLMSYRFPNDSSFAVSVSQRFTVDDGLPSNQITSLEFVDEYLWIGTRSGLCRFWWANPARDYTN